MFYENMGVLCYIDEAVKKEAWDLHMQCNGRVDYEILLRTVGAMEAEMRIAGNPKLLDNIPLSN